MKRNLNTVLMFFFVLVIGEVNAQEIVVWKNMYIHEKASVGMFDHVTNTTDILVNEGHLILENSSLRNDVPLKGTGTLEVEGNLAQDLYGGADIRQGQLILDNSSSFKIGFDLNIYVSAHANFKNGILADYDLQDYVDPRELYYVQFESGATIENVRNASHVEGTVKKVGTSPFLFPVGDRGYYRPVYTKGSENSETFTAKYFCCPNPFPEENVPAGIDLQREEYWFLESTQPVFSMDISYSSQTSQFRPEEVMKLSVAQYDGIFDEDDKVNVELTEEDIDVPDNNFTFYGTEVNNSTLFKSEFDPTIWYSFAAVEIADGEFPQLVTPNGDGSNDVFDVPEKYLFTDNKIEIFNRYGNIVFKTSNYDNTWDGKPNQPSLGGQDGYLPSGTYYVFFYESGKLIYKDFLQLVHDK